MQTVTIVAKGPSAVNAIQWIQEAETDVATVNDAAALIPGVNVDYCFFTHFRFTDRLRHVDQPQTKYVAPSLMQHENRDAPDWMSQRLTEYPDRQCEGDKESLQARIIEGGICHHNTVNGALHWLAKFGRYDRIRIIGVDGGTGYADGAGGLSDALDAELKAKNDRPYFDVWKEVTERLCEILMAVYGVEVDWYGH